MADTNTNETPMTGPPINAISWTEIPCTDVKPMKEFYSSVFEWNVGDINPYGEHHSMAMFDKGPCHGSFIQVPKDQFLTPAHKHTGEKGVCVRVTITVSSVDEMMKKIVKAGGEEYLPKREIPGNMGFVSYFLDPAKNIMGIWSQN